MNENMNGCVTAYKEACRSQFFPLSRIGSGITLRLAGLAEAPLSVEPSCQPSRPPVSSHIATWDICPLSLYTVLLEGTALILLLEIPKERSLYVVFLQNFGKEFKKKLWLFAFTDIIYSSSL